MSTSSRYSCWEACSVMFLGPGCSSGLLKSEILAQVAQWGLLKPHLHPSSSYPWISRFNPKPSGGFVCGFTCGFNFPSLCLSCNIQLIKDFADGQTCKTSASNLYGLTEHLPARVLALLHQLLVSCAFLLLCFFRALIPGHCESQHFQVFCHLRHDGRVWPG